MTRVCHIFDESTGWEQRVAVGQLLDLLPRDAVAQHLVATDSRARGALGDVGAAATLILRRLGLAALVAPRLRGFLTDRRIDIIHAWGTTAAVAARAASHRPMIVELSDPVAACRDVKLLRTLASSGRLAVSASCGLVRRRLIEGGLEPERVVVIRPGVDFARVNHYRRGNIRAQLGIEQMDTLVCLPPPVTRAGGHFDAAYAVSVVNHVFGRYRVVIPGRSRELRRIARFNATLPIRSALICPADRIEVEALIAVSDVLLMAARGDVSTTSIAWAMASNTAIVAAAGYAVAELIANKVNGLLFKSTRGRSMMSSIAQRLGDRGALTKAREVARGQAYEVFGLRRYAEDHRRLYENVGADRAPGTGIEDAARIG